MTQEKILTFGQQRNLTGIVSLPDEIELAEMSKKPAIIFLNAGFLHQVGPYRLTVDLCRTLCDSGFLAFRFDLSGIGDSPASKTKSSHDTQVTNDVQTAIDLLQKRFNIDRFIIAGLCTGADNAHKVTAIDERICGSIFMDGYAYPTRKYKLLRYAPVLLDPIRATNYAFKKLNTTNIDEQEFIQNTSEESDITWDLPPLSKTLEDMALFVARNVKLLMIFSGGNIRSYNHLGQAKDMYQSIDFGKCLTEIFNQEADHTYMLQVDRSKLIKQISNWVINNFMK
jgi:Serine aminopeptidase, S33